MANRETTLKKLFDDSMPNGGLPAFRTNFEQSIGIHTNDNGVQVFDKDKRTLDYKSLEIGRVMNGICGPAWRNAFENNWQRGSAMRFEGVGGTVIGGDLPYVSAALDVIAGLANARALERPAAPEFIWDKFCTVTEITGEGGFDIIVRSDGNPPSTDLADGQPIPTVYLKGSRVHRNRTMNQGLRTKINKYTILDDLTGTLYGAIDENADQVLNERERKVADLVLGIGTAAAPNLGMSQDGLTFFHYQKGVYGANAGAGVPSPQNQKQIQNFANCNDSDSNGLSDYTLLTRALAILTANRDPFTNLPVNVSMQGLMMFVAPRSIPQAQFILQGEALWQIANSGLSTTGGTNTVSSLNLMKEYGIQLVTSQLWANRLVDVGITKVAANGAKTYQVMTNAVADTYTTANSIAGFHALGHFDRAVRYAQRQPYTVMQVPLSSVEYAEETVLVQDVRERGQAYVVRPQLMYRAGA